MVMDLENMMDDVKYSKAMNTEDPDQAKPWPKFTDEVLAEFEQTQGPLTLADICAGPFGLYCFIRFIATSGKQTEKFMLPAKFILDAAECKLEFNPNVQREKLKAIMDTYLLVESPSPLAAANLEFGKDTTLRARTPDVDQVLYRKHIKAASPRRASMMRASRSGKMSDFGGSDWPLLAVKELLDGDEGMAALEKVEPLVFEFLSIACTPLFKKSDRYFGPDGYLRFLKIQCTPATEENFNTFRTVGKGGFGIVYGCRTFYTGRMYAMKLCDKKHVKRGKAQHLCENEHWALSLLDSPFTVNLKYAYQTPRALVLIIDLALGGDLKYWMEKKTKFDEPLAQFYACRTILGLKVLHDAGIVYRDLKPENVLVDEDGRTRISDLGLACKAVPDLKGLSGTPGYLAPEMIKKETYDYTVDWFSYGCMIYEFLFGKSPFRSHKAHSYIPGERDLIKNINAATKDMEVEDFEGFSDSAKDFCQKLLRKDPTKRLGKGGAQELMQHKWFKNIDWGKMMADDVEPPWAPGKGLNIKDADSIGDFADLGNEVTLAPEDFPEKDWTFTSPKAFQSEVVWWMKFEEAKRVGNGPRKKSGTSGGGSSFCVVC